MDESKSPINQSCVTGYSPSGHCGAAYYCSEPYQCCAACPRRCNSWDRERARALLEEGKRDQEIADAVGCSLPAFRSWKQREGLAQQRRERCGRDTAPTAPGDTGKPCPVGLSLSLCGCAVTAEAPDLGRAIQLLKLLRNIEREGTSGAGGG